MPADCALVRPEVVRRLLCGQSEAGGGILHPTCCGLRGHPPLVSARYREELAGGEGSGAHGPGVDGLGDLRDFFRRHSDQERELEVEDLTILMDMDTPEEYRRLQRFAALIGGLERGQEHGGMGPGRVSLGASDALYLLALLAAPEHLMKHCQTVAAVGLTLAVALKPRTPALDVDLVHCACLLHDLAKGARRHAVVGQRLLENLGLHRLGTLVGSHMVIPPEGPGGAAITEEELVYLADKLVISDRVIGLEERTAESLERYREDADAVLAIERRMGAAAAIRGKVEAALNTTLEEVLGGALTSPRW
jgi:molybdenum cofactor cytidylyltransferase